MTSKVDKNRKHASSNFRKILLIIGILQNYRKTLKALSEVVTVAWQGPFLSPKPTAPPGSFLGVEAPRKLLRSFETTENLSKPSMKLSWLLGRGLFPLQKDTLPLQNDL